MTPAERRLARRLDRPSAVQGWLRTLPYNREPHGPTLRSFRGVVHHRTAHCLEAALAAAAILETHGYPPLLLDLESQDHLDHVVFAFRGRRGWGAVGGSRDVGLWGRKARFRSVEALARSYYEPFIDLTARITAFALVDLSELTRCDWRLSSRNVWKVERYLIAATHRPMATSDRRYLRLKETYRVFAEHHDPTDTPFTRGSHAWM